MGRHLGDEALRDRRGAARDLLTDGIACAPARVDRREVAADEHDVARPAEGVADPERDHVLLVAGALVHDPGGVVPEEAHPGIPRRRLDEAALALDLDVLADDLDQVLARVLQVQRRAGELQAQRIAEERPLEHLLADRDEDLDVIVDRMQVARRERDADLGEMPVAAIDRALLLGVDQVAGEKILEILVDVVDEHGDRAVDAPEHRQQMRHIVLERREIGVARQGQKIGEQIARAAQMLVAHHLVERSRRARGRSPDASRPRASARSTRAPSSRPRSRARCRTRGGSSGPDWRSACRPGPARAASCGSARASTGAWP